MSRMCLIVVLSLLVIASCAPKPRIRDLRTRSDIRNLEAAVHLFEDDCRRLPTNLTELVQRPQDASWRGPYLEAKGLDSTALFRDQWGSDLRYMPQGTRFVIRSAGPDRTFNTDDDMTN